MTLLATEPAVPLCEGIAGRVRPGDGDKILWVHGYTLDSSSWGEMWRLLPGWYHLGIDLPGHGASGPVAEVESLPALARRLGEFCRRQGVRHVVGLSFGTITTTQMVLEFPDLFSSVVLAAPSLAGAPQDPEVEQTYTRLGQLYHFLGPGAHLRAVWMRCRAWNGVEKRPRLREVLAELVGQHSWQELKGFAIRRLLEPPQPEAALRRIHAPVLTLVGDQELPAFRDCAAVLQRVLPRCSGHELADTGHLCLLQSPEPAAVVIDAHLRAHALRAPATAAAS
jgi:2-succinyl-6-hydroxy-2,4-cyclohexadiene-1-carboxylate synthase